MMTKLNRAMALAAVLSSLHPLLSSGHDEFALAWSGSRFYTNSAGQLVIVTYSNKDIIQKVAQNEGVDPQTLILVYRADALDAAVVDKATGGTIQDHFLLLPDITRVGTPSDNQITKSNANGTAVHTVRQAMVYDEFHTQPFGSIFGFENLRYNSTGTLISDSYSGTFQLSYDGVGGLMPSGLYRGSFHTGRRITDTADP